MATMINPDVEQGHGRLDELRRSYDEGARRAPSGDTGSTREYLMVMLSGEAYAFPVSCALEVLPVPPIVPVPGTPPSVLGIINFRGQILSVTEIHELLGLTAGERGAASRIIVTRNLPLVTGILVDCAVGIVALEAQEIRPLPAAMREQQTRLFSGQASVREEVVFFLDMEQVCGSETLHVPQLRPSS